MMARAAFSYIGGKHYLLPTILPLLQSHTTWVELFCGASWVTLAKPRAACELINDIDDGVSGFYRVLRDPGQFERLQALLELTPYSRAEYAACRTSWQDCTDPVERARRWFVVVRQSFSGRLGWGGWSYSIKSDCRMANTTSKWLGAIEGLSEVHERLRGVQIECADYRRVLSFWNRPEVLLYADPPYVWGTRTGKRLYRHEMTDADHRELVGLLLTFRGMVLLSGYAHEIYAPLEHAGWQRIDIATTAHSAGRTRATGILGAGAATRQQARTECLWMNYDPAVGRGQMRLEASS